MPTPEVIAEETVESLTAALEQFALLAAELRGETNGASTDGSVEDAVEDLVPDDEHRI